MKRFLSAVALCVGLLFIAVLSFLLPPISAQNNVLQELLDFPAPPPPNPLFAGRNSANRAANFFNKKNPPADDAPLEDLLEYWHRQSTNYAQLGYNITPSKKSLERILAEIEKNPESLTNYLNALPRNSEIVEFVKKLYDEYKDDEELSEGWKESVKYWLTYNSKYFSEDLAKEADKVADTEQYVTNQEELLALARVDWEKARPIVERFYNDRSQPVSWVLARWAYYIHALESGSTIDADRYRDELKAVVEDKNATSGMRDLALDALVKEKEWDGRDEWYLSLLGDETLAELEVNGQIFTGLTTIIFVSPPEKFLDKMIELVKSDNKTVRTAAVRNLSLLISSERPEVIRALLPWLQSADWAKEYSYERSTLIRALAEIKMPESVPGLIAVLNEKQTSERINYNSNVNIAVNRPTNRAVNTVKANSAEIYESYPYRSVAVAALAKQGDARAVVPLRRILPIVETWERAPVINAILLSGGFSLNEQIEALEKSAKNYIEAANTSNYNTVNSANIYNTYPANTYTYPVNNTYYYSNQNINREITAAEIQYHLATNLINNREPAEQLVRALVLRISDWDKKDTRISYFLRSVIKNWNGAAVNSMMMEDLKNNRADIDIIIKLLSLRKELQEKQSEEISAMRGGNQTADAIGACIFESESDYQAILDKEEEAEAKIALLGCARLIRAPLPLKNVIPLLKHPNKMLALAAERWLESEDSAEARQAVLAANPNKAKVLGARTAFNPTESKNNRFLSELFSTIKNTVVFPDYYGISDENTLAAIEKRLQKEVLEDTEILGIYAFDRNFIKIYKDRAVFAWEEDDSRYRERTLTTEEFDELKNFFVSQEVDSLKPFLSYCFNCYEKELIMVGKQGGRRVFVRADKAPPFFAKLDEIFGKMRNQPAKLHYHLEKSVPGLEILFADEQLKALTVWKNGDDLRVLIEDSERRKQIDKELEKLDEEAMESVDEDGDYEKIENESRKRREDRQYEHLSWRKTANGNLSGIAAQPANFDFIPVRDSFPARASLEQWKARTATFEIRDGDDDLVKISNGQVTKIADGYYTNQVVTPNGRWVVVSKYDTETDEISLVRINLATKKEYVVPKQMRAVAFIPSINRVLVTPLAYYEYAYNYDYYYLLDAETGTVTEIKAELRPLIQQTSRALQPTGNPDEFWAAIFDQITKQTQFGTYNAKTFTFKPLMKIPQIKFESMQMWVDGGKVYFVYEGHLLALPIPK